MMPCFPKLKEPTMRAHIRLDLSIHAAPPARNSMEALMPPVLLVSFVSYAIRPEGGQLRPQLQ